MDESQDQYEKEMQVLKEKFVVEAEEKIASLESSTLQLEEDPENQEQIDLLFGAMHTLKGNGGMFGFETISEFTHDLETIYDYVKRGKLEVTTELLTITLQAVDHLKVLLRAGETLDEETEKVHNAKTAAVKDFASSKLNAVRAPEKKADNVLLDEPSEIEELLTATYFISFKPHESIFDNGTKPLYLIDEIQSLGDTFVIPHTELIPDLKDLNPLHCYTYWELFLSTSESEGTIADVFIFVEDESNIVIQQIAEDNLFDFQQFTSYLENLKTNKQLTNLKALKNLILDLPARELPEDLPGDIINPEIKAPLIIPEPETQKPLTAQKPAPKIKPSTQQPIAGSKAAESTISSIRVSSEKVDKLMNLVSEMVTIQARLSMYAEKTNDLELIAIAENVQKLSKQLRDNAFSISLIPIASILTRFQRLVRDLSSSLGKKVKFVIEGQGTELDKTIIERITDPLLHILRNSLDHGIETPDVRKANGKPEEGTIQFTASYSGSNILIEVKDDGAGIDKNIILEKAIKSNLITESENLSETEIFNLIFTPGFSTAKQVSDVSGRGVGMDVVRKKISELRGDVFINSELGKGSSITIVLPLTLSIIDGMQVKIDNTSFIIPTSSVHKIYSVKHQQVAKAFDNLIILDGKQLPYFYLREQFSLNGKAPIKEEVLVVKYENHEVGLIIDKIVGEFQTVLKPLGMHYKNQEFISGGTILGDGSVALVLDTNKIISRLSKENKTKL